MESSPSSSKDAKTEDDGFDRDKEALYEYKIRELFSRARDRKDHENFEAKLDFHLSLLNVRSTWEVKKLEWANRSRVFSLYRRLEFLPCLNDTTKWSITVDLSDNFATPKQGVMGPFKEYRCLTANNENPSVEFEYAVRCKWDSDLFSDPELDYYSNLKVNVIECKGLSAYLTPSVDFTKPFEGSNVILRIDEGTHYYYVFELLALHSSIFFRKWIDRNHLPLENDHHVVVMDDTDVPGLINILKTITYKRNYLQLDCVEDVALVANRWKFELLMASCEDYFIENVRESTLHKYNILAQKYDMSLLQHYIWSNQKDTAEKLQEQGQKEVKRRRLSEAKTPTSDHILQHVISEKLDLPEIQRSFMFNRETPTKFQLREGKAIVAVITALVDWKVMWTRNPNGSLIFSVQMDIPTSKRPFSSSNWSVKAIFYVIVNGNQMKFSVNFSQKTYILNFDPQVKTKDMDDINFNVKVDIVSIQGLRFLVKDSMLRSFNSRTPTSDIVLHCRDRKLFANLNILAMFSMFFQALKDNSEMQTMDPSEHLPLVKMEDVESETVVQILNYVYGINRTPIEDRYLEDMTVVADRFVFNGLLFVCEQSLGSPHFSLESQTLDFALRYNLPILKNNYLEQFKTVEDCQKLKDKTGYDDMSETAKSLLFERMMSLPATHNCSDTD